MTNIVWFRKNIIFNWKIWRFIFSK